MLLDLESSTNRARWLKYQYVISSFHTSLKEGRPLRLRKDESVPNLEDLARELGSQIVNICFIICGRLKPCYIAYPYRVRPKVKTPVRQRNLTLVGDICPQRGAGGGADRTSRASRNNLKAISDAGAVTIHIARRKKQEFTAREDLPATRSSLINWHRI